MKTNKAGLDIIMKFEGCELKAYKCPAGIWTIGYGNTYYKDGTKIKDGDEISKKEAVELLATILPIYEKMVTSNIKASINENQFSALVSYVYNTGGSNTLYKLINAKSSSDIIREWIETHYISGGGKVLKGLITRRKAESELYFKPIK
tara:strand:- start:37 stop:480 length:444 start_codon:yes stop_codon:yes gene_type:complete